MSNLLCSVKPIFRLLLFLLLMFLHHSRIMIATECSQLVPQLISIITIIFVLMREGNTDGQNATNEQKRGGQGFCSVNDVWISTGSVSFSLNVNDYTWRLSIWKAKTEQKTTFHFPFLFSSFKIHSELTYHMKEMEGQSHWCTTEDMIHLVMCASNGRLNTDFL